MITAGHILIYTEDEAATRAFFRDVLELPNVDSGGGWLIFKLPPAELGVHPAAPGTSRHELSLMCDDLEKTIAELTAKGAEFTSGISEERWGRIITMRLPGAGEIGLYEPKHPLAYQLLG